MDGGSPLGNVTRQIKPPTRVVDLLAAQLTMVILALSIVALRLVARFFVDKNPGWDDYIIIAATVKQDQTPEEKASLTDWYRSWRFFNQFSYFHAYLMAQANIFGISKTQMIWPIH